VWNTHLIDTSELEIDTEVLLIQRLKTRVQQSTQQRVPNLLHNLRSSLLRIMFRHRRAQPTLSHRNQSLISDPNTLRRDRETERRTEKNDSPIIIHIVRLGQLMVRAHNDLQLTRRNVDGAKDRDEEETVVFDSERDEG